MKRNNYLQLLSVSLLGLALTACKLGNPNDNITVDPDPEKADLPEWYWTGGKLGTTYFNSTQNCFEQSTAAVDKMGKGGDFTVGDQIAERPFNTNAMGTRSGLGPVYVRASCQHCHPSYSHGMSVPAGTYNARDISNGTLLVVINPATQGYVTWLAGMPQLFGVAPFKAPLDPDQKHAEWWTDDKEANIYNYLTSKDLPAEMTDDEFTQFMVWHRGLAVPAARNVTDSAVLRGKELFSQIGCDYCHRPTWTTGADVIRDPNTQMNLSSNDLPRYPNQKIWPYTDMVQHKLHMENDIRTGWCRTTPLWGRGLHRKATGDAYEARMHDTRARNVVEAIMWHGYSRQSDAYYPTQQFWKLSKEDRDAVVAFINAI